MDGALTVQGERLWYRPPTNKKCSANLYAKSASSRKNNIFSSLAPRYVLSVCNGEIEEGLEGRRRCLVRKLVPQLPSHHTQLLSQLLCPVALPR
jgi:hypothetical protein